jgi:pimeloyl-ACP methyl ester carboxylesterase
MSAIQKHHGTFKYRNKDIPFIYWTNTDGNASPDTIIFMGAGQINKAPYWTAEYAGSGVAVAEALPHWHVSEEDWAAEEFCTQYQLAVFQDVLQRFELQSAHLVAESQAGAISVILAHKIPHKVRSLALVMPLGFTASAYGQTNEERLKTFKKRLLANHLQQLRTRSRTRSRDWWRKLQGKLDVLRIVLREPSLKLLGQKYADGVSTDILQECREVAHTFHQLGKPFTIILGEKDVLFPPSEVLAAIRQAGVKHVKIDILPGATHTSLSARASKPILDKVLAIGRAKKAHSTRSAVAA